MTRRWELDALRGLMLVLMTLTHLPTRFSGPAGQPFGWVSAAEGFVFLSAFMAGMVYSDIALKRGVGAMWRALSARAFTVYVCQAALLLFLFTVIAALGIRVDQPAVKNLMLFYLEDPAIALRAALVMLYNPPLLDILPMYVLFMLASPWIMLHGLTRGWRTLLLASAGLWFAAQFGFEAAAYRWLAGWSGLQVPIEQTGAFDLVAWQLLWVFGLALGAGGLRSGNDPAGPAGMPRWWARGALAVAIVCLAWRHWRGMLPFEHWQHLNWLFGKWHLAPLRLINFLALVSVVLHYGPAIASRVPRLGALEKLGAASLPVFCAHLVVVLLALALLGPASDERALWIDVALVGATFVVLYVVAEVTRLGGVGVAALTAWRAGLSGSAR